jgi:hypothetical protein
LFVLFAKDDIDSFWKVHAAGFIKLQNSLHALLKSVHGRYNSNNNNNNNSDKERELLSNVLKEKSQAIWGVVAGILHLSRVSIGEGESDSGPAAYLHPPPPSTTVSSKASYSLDNDDDNDNDNDDGQSQKSSVELSKASLSMAAKLFGIEEGNLAGLLLEREMDLASGESFSIKLKVLYLFIFFLKVYFYIYHVDLKHHQQSYV